MGEEKEDRTRLRCGRGTPGPIHTSMDPPSERGPLEVIALFNQFIHDPFGF